MVNRARYGRQVHGTCSESLRDLIGMRIIGCDTGDSPRGHGGGRATAAVGRGVESSQSEESSETATSGPLPGTVPAVADSRGNKVGWWMVNRARYGRQVHGICSESLRDFIGMRIIWCDTGDSPRGHGGRRATAAVGRAVESSQSEESSETATSGPLPGTVPAVADNWGNQVGWWMVNRACYGRQVHGNCSESLPHTSAPPRRDVMGRMGRMGLMRGGAIVPKVSCTSPTHRNEIRPPTPQQTPLPSRAREEAESPPRRPAVNPRLHGPQAVSMAVRRTSSPSPPGCGQWR